MKQPIILLIKKPNPSLFEKLTALYDVRSEPGPEITAVVTGAREGIEIAQIDQLPSLKTVAVHGIGCDRIPLEYLTKKAISLAITPDVLTDDVADLAIGLMLAVLRRIPQNDRFVRDGRWVSEGMPPLASRLAGRKIGILGLGKIGKAIAKRAQSFEVELAYTSRHRDPEALWRFEPDMDQLARWSQIMIIAVAGGAETAKLVGPAMLDALGPDGVLINVSRGSVVDEAALVTALKSRALGGAGLDVFSNEPAVPAELRALDNVVLQPHQGSATVETRAAMENLVLANLGAHFRGAALPGLVT